jgi:hypothetical protein
MQQLINQAINQQERSNNSCYSAAETNQLEPTHYRNQTRFPVNWLRTPTVRLNLDLALPHWCNASARIPATNRAVWYPTAHACTTSGANDSSRPEIEPWHEQQAIKATATKVLV